MNTVDPSDPNNFAWSGAHMDWNAGNTENWNQDVDMVKRPLWPFVKTAAVFKCPADHTSITDNNGIVRPRILTMSMNLFVGGFAPPAGQGRNGTDGGWSWANPFNVYSKSSLINEPSKIFVFLDMRPDTVNWSNFMTDMENYGSGTGLQYTTDRPGIYHNNAAGFSFADGHSEMHAWKDPSTLEPIHNDHNYSPPSSTPDPQGIDVAWLQDHTTRRR